MDVIYLLLYIYVLYIYIYIYIWRIFINSYYIYFKLLMILFSIEWCLLKVAFFWKNMLVVIYAKKLYYTCIPTIYENFKSMLLFI